MTGLFAWKGAAWPPVTSSAASQLTLATTPAPARAIAGATCSVTLPIPRARRLWPRLATNALKT